MNVNLAVQILSPSLARMIRDAMKDIEVIISLTEKDMLNQLADLCEKWIMLLIYAMAEIDHTHQRIHPIGNDSPGCS